MRRALGLAFLSVVALLVWPFVAANNLLGPLVGPPVALMFGREYVARPYVISSSAMEPTLHCARTSAGCKAGTADRVLVNRFTYAFRSPQRGEIVVFDTPPRAERKCGAGGKFIKRVVGLPGETVELRLVHGREHVYIDGRRLEEPYVLPDRRGSGPAKTYEVPEGSYLLLGDNRSSSCDSRIFGAVPESAIVGDAVLTYWPPGRISFR